MSQWSVAPALIVGQCVKDLSSRDRQRVSPSLNRLKKLSIEDDTFQRHVVTAVIPLLENIFHDDDAHALISKYGVADEDLPALMRLYRSRRNQREVGRLLATTKDPTVLQFLASQMGPANSDIERLFTELGPDGEPYMWPLLQNSSHIVRGMACRVLAKIGTEKSLAELTRLLGDTLSNRDAKVAIDIIQRREVDRS